MRSNGQLTVVQVMYKNLLKNIYIYISKTDSGRLPHNVCNSRKKSCRASVYPNVNVVRRRCRAYVVIRLRCKSYKTPPLETVLSAKCRGKSLQLPSESRTWVKATMSSPWPLESILWTSLCALRSRCFFLRFDSDCSLSVVRFSTFILVCIERIAFLRIFLGIALQTILDLVILSVSLSRRGKRLLICNIGPVNLVNGCHIAGLIYLVEELVLSLLNVFSKHLPDETLCLVLECFTCLIAMVLNKSCQCLFGHLLQCSSKMLKYELGFDIFVALDRY